MRLEDNVYNRTLRADQPKFKLWRSVGLMLTYGCPSRCACCYVFAGPKAATPETEMSVARALACWEGVRRLARERGKVHLTGGEPFLNYPRLREILRQAQEQGLQGLEKVETNAFWCTREELVRERLEELREFGLTKLQISTDVYHQEYIPRERVILAVRVAREVLGPEGVQVRWWDSLDEPGEGRAVVSERQAERFRRALAQRGERLLGRAAVELASLIPSKDYADLSDCSCKAELLGAAHVHVDGAGHVFPGTCVGIVLGRLERDKPEELGELWCRFDWRRHPVIRTLVEQGPVGLAEQLKPAGFVPRKAYAGKCQLCFEVRRFCRSRGRWTDWLGPANCYGTNRSEDNRPDGRNLTLTGRKTGP